MWVGTCVCLDYTQKHKLLISDMYIMQRCWYNRLSARMSLPLLHHRLWLRKFADGVFLLIFCVLLEKIKQLVLHYLQPIKPVVKYWILHIWIFFNYRTIIGLLTGNMKT